MYPMLVMDSPQTYTKSFSQEYIILIILVESKYLFKSKILFYEKMWIFIIVAYVFSK
jgi:hypothetical protein